MPDWSYRTLFRPALFRLGPEAGRAFTLRAMGALSRVPGGTLVIRTLGHMERYPRLEESRFGLDFRFPVGLSGEVDPHGWAQRALSPFGFGYIEVGPVTVEAQEPAGPMALDAEREAIVYADRDAGDGLERIAGRAKQEARLPQPRFFRLRPLRGSTPGEAYRQLAEMMDRLQDAADGFVLDPLDDRPQSLEETARLLEELRARHERLPAGRRGGRRPLLLYVPGELADDRMSALLAAIELAAWDGIVIGGGRREPDGRLAVGREDKPLVLERVRAVRALCSREQLVIAAGGVHEPQDAVEMRRAGADFVQLHSGLVFAGPGLPKRINELLLYERIRLEPEPQLAGFWQHWGWMCLLGLGMLLGGVLAWWIAATYVLLPYDERFLGMSRERLAALQPRLLDFMSHDRITLAGTMMSIGIVYGLLGFHGLRRELHWAKTALLVSGIVGFSSFFLYLGYGYLNPLHAAAAAALLPMFVLAMRGSADRPSRLEPDRRSDSVWRRAQWGQLLWVALGFALAAGGLTIAVVGVTKVFVAEDLAFLAAAPAELAAINDRLLPLVAHDRAGFGGALFSLALALLATALWGIRPGERWIWWMFALGGVPGFAGGLSVHLAIGYTDFIHLLPLYAAVLLYAGGLVLLYPYLMRRAA